MLEIGKIKNTLLNGHALDVIKNIPDESIDMVITSPPYFALRNYETISRMWGGDPECNHEWVDIRKVCSGGLGRKQDTSKGSWYDRNVKYCMKCTGYQGELGLEPFFGNKTIDVDGKQLVFRGYISHLVDIFDEVKRVLKPTGTFFLNIGDTYYGGNKNEGGLESALRNKQGTNKGSFGNIGGSLFKNKELPDKCLCMIPQRIAIEMMDRGWILRNNLVWHKSNSFPNPARDRFGMKWENVFLFSKKSSYYFEQQFESCAGTERTQDVFSDDYTDDKLTRIMRCVWSIPIEPFSAKKVGIDYTDHFAAFPKKLIETPIRAGCPEFVCKSCGKPRFPIYKTEKVSRNRETPFTQPTLDRSKSPNDYKGTKILGVEYSDCGCNAGFEAGIVLDIFMGTGTVAVVSSLLKRNWIGIEISPEFCHITQRRLEVDVRIQNTQILDKYGNKVKDERSCESCVVQYCMLRTFNDPCPKWKV